MPTRNATSSAAIRTRRYRDRRDRGAVVINFEVEADHLECLVDQGFLAADEATDRAKVADALGLVLFGLSEGDLEMNWDRYA